MEIYSKVCKDFMFMSIFPCAVLEGSTLLTAREREDQSTELIYANHKNFLQH